MDYNMDYCQTCRSPFEDNHSCMQFLKVRLQSMQNLAQVQQAQLTNLTNLSKSLDAERPGLSYTQIEHEFIGCDGCGAIPIKGIRYKCKECLDFDFCKSCRFSVPHEHSEFFWMTNSGVHLNKTCNSCGENPLKSVLYNCNSCNLQYCHTCVMREGHQHPTEAFLPYALKVEVYANKRDFWFKANEQVVLTFVVRNISTQKVDRVRLLNTGGKMPFEYESFEMDLSIEFMETRVVQIESKINLGNGSYLGTFRFFSTKDQEYIGPEIELNLRVGGFISKFLKTKV